MDRREPTRPDYQALRAAQDEDDALAHATPQDPPTSRGEREVAGIERLVERERERAAAMALQAVRRSLARHGAAYTLGVLLSLEQQPLRATLEALDRDGE